MSKCIRKMSKYINYFFVLSVVGLVTSTGTKWAWAAATSSAIYTAPAGAGSGAGAADGSGFNNYFIPQYLISKYGNCADCPTNMHAMTKADIEAVLNQMSGTSLHHFREGLAMGSHFPTNSSPRYIDDVAEILRLYQDRNATVILTFGMPVPTWMSGEKYSWCPMPKSESDWNNLKNNLSWAIGGLFKALWNHPKLDKNWMKARLIVEPFNEFDSIHTLDGTECKMLHGTGTRAASLAGGVQFVLNHYSVPLIVTTPSAVTGNPNYFKDFYTAGGVGQPNIHLYPPYDGNDYTSPSSVDSYIDKVVSHLTQTNAVIPAQYQNRFILGEYALAGAEAPCKPSDRPGGTIAGEARRNFLNKAFGDARIQAMSEINLTWRSVDVAPQSFNSDLWSNPALHCETRFGAFRDDYSPKPQVVEYLRANDGIDLIADKTRLGFLRSKVNILFQLHKKRQATESEMRGLLNKRIYEDATWAELEVLIKNAPMIPPADPVPPSPPADPLPPPSSAIQVINTTFTTLKNYHGACDVSAPASAQCMAAANRYCSKNLGAAGGYTVGLFQGDSAQVVCLAPAQSSYVVTSFSVLRTYHNACTSSDVALSGPCVAASSRYCFANGYTTGFGALEYNGDAAAIICTKAASGLLIDISQLRAYRPSCSTSAAGSADCIGASNSYCQAKGFAAGFGIVEYSGDSVRVDCLR